MDEVPGFYVSQLSRHILSDYISSYSYPVDKFPCPPHSFLVISEYNAVSPLFPKLLAALEVLFDGVFLGYFSRQPCVDRRSENYDIQFFLASRIGI